MLSLDDSGEFVDKHIECNPNYFNFNLNGNPGFSLFTESDYDPNR